MRPIDRLYKYLNYRKLKPSLFETTCKISNGYLNKQFKGKGTIGSAIIAKIHKAYSELNLEWILTGTGEMLVTGDMEDDLVTDQSKIGARTSNNSFVIDLLTQKIEILESLLSDKNKIIALLEEKLDTKTKLISNSVKE